MEQSWELGVDVEFVEKRGKGSNRVNRLKCIILLPTMGEICTHNGCLATQSYQVRPMLSIISGEGGGTQVNHVVIHEQKNAGKDSFLHII